MSIRPSSLQRRPRIGAVSGTTGTLLLAMMLASPCAEARSPGARDAFEAVASHGLHSGHAALFLPGPQVHGLAWTGSGPATHPDLGGQGVTMRGLAYRDRASIASALVLAGHAGAAVLGLGGLVATGATTETGRTTTTSTRYQADGTRIETRTTRVDYRVNADAAQSAADLMNSAGPAAGEVAMLNRVALELDVLLAMPDVPVIAGTARGFRANFLFYFPIGTVAIMDAGVGYHRIYTLYEDESIAGNYRFFGVPLRLHFPFGPFYATAGWDVNFLVLGSARSTRQTTLDRETPLETMRLAPSPVSLGLTGVAGPLTATATVRSGRPTEGDYGLELIAGLRF
ncbi:MAG: hypothetical protein EA398_02780 [Deltaproteobacteria bacterium]|nr:MAG: hypothetical protein EA398_02780 [Deltaproteobacteria bacterium]